MSLKILHLEDNLLDAELVEANLSDSGFSCEVNRVDTREDFIAAIEDGDFELILADYSLPSFDGLSALEIAQAVCPDLPFIIISGALGEELAIETLKSGATDYILKHRLERLAPSVRRAMRESAEREARKQAERDRQLLFEREQEARFKAEEASRLKDEFLATVSHELRTPLNAIYGWATMLKNGKLSAHDKINAVEIIERNARVQIQLIEDLLDVSRMIAGNLRLDIESVNLSDIISASIDAVRPAAAAKAIEIESRLNENQPTIFADSSRLQQIIWNLLLNAVKFTAKNGKVIIGVQSSGQQTEIFVRDNGTGIAAEFLPHVFDRFRQAVQATTRVHGGLGLGLAIVKNLVEMHGGSITAESGGIGHGATFRVYLPQIALGESTRPEITKTLPVITPTAKTNYAPHLIGMHILAVDDDEDSLELLQVLLEKHGAVVSVAGSVTQAIRILQDFSPDVLLSDVGMPIEDGYSLISRIRSEQKGNRQIPAIAITGFARVEDEQRALNSGFNAHITKPIEPEKLVEIIIRMKKPKN